MMPNTLITPVLLSGGAGSRLWPLSRTLYPKQLLVLVQERTMLQETGLRVANPALYAAPLIVAGEDHRFLIADQLSEAGIISSAIILEPAGRNTAPAVAIAAHTALSLDTNAVLLVMPTDQVILDGAAFDAAVAKALPVAKAGGLVTFGVAPDGPATGYGYIECGADIGDGIFNVARFVEKPNRERAEQFIASGNYSWNAGIFLLNARSYLDELARLAPEMARNIAAAMNNASVDGPFVRPDSTEFLACPSDSIDYAVMERTDKAAVVPVSMGWSDVGSWDALWDIGVKSDTGNVSVGDVVMLDTHDCLVRSDGGPMIATVGLRDTIVIATKDAVLVAPRDRAQDVKAVVDHLKATGRNEYKLHSVVHRPWGTYQTVDQDAGFQTKRITVKPGQQLSLQLHHKRSEHWVVVRGEATVTVGDKVEILRPNQSTYIPIGTKHRLENHGKETLYLIEVQCGDYLGEDDIVRFDDKYGRTGTIG
jgi:mannose-1-phosphate guanylyltransferase / mannose-6-phosphate isomerase